MGANGNNGDGRLGAARIHIVPATPVGGGVAAANAAAQSGLSVGEFPILHYHFDSMHGRQRTFPTRKRIPAGARLP